MSEELLAGLDEALSYDGNHTLGDVLRKILHGEAQLWEEDDAVIVTEIQQYPRARVVHFWLAAGDLGAVVRLSHRVMAWAKRDMHCEKATLAGRKGWERALASEGWEPTVRIMGRDL